MSRIRWMLLGVGILMGFALTTSVVLAEEVKAEGEAAKAPATVELPEAAAKAVKDAYPTATVEKVEAEDEDGVKLYEVKLVQGEATTEVVVAADGTIAAVETIVAMKDVPEAVAKAIETAAKGAEVKKIEKEEIRAEVKKAKEGEPAKLVKLEKPKVEYEAKLIKGETESEVKVAADGTVIPEEAEEKVEAPKVEEPKMEMPKVEAPKVEEPKMEMPKVEAPKVEEPKMEMPKAAEPSTN